VGHAIALLLIVCTFYFRNLGFFFVALFVFMAGRPIQMKPARPGSTPSLNGQD
jgi:hypothetical protein